MYKKVWFKWQYSNEKLLLKKHENIFSYIFRKIYLFLVYIILSWVFYTLSNYFFEPKFISYFWVLIIYIILILYIIYQYKNSWMIVTNKRVLKLIKNTIFIDHKRELKLVDIKANLLKRDFSTFVFWYWTIEIQWTDHKSNIYFTWVKPHEDILNYISKIIDISKNKPEELENIKEYINRKSKR